MQKPQRFRVRLQDAGGGGAAFDVPARAAAALGERKRPPVTVTIGDHTFRTTVAVYGGQPMVGVNKLSYTHRREYVDWVAEAKRPATRARRVAQTVERVRTGARD